MFYPIPFQVYDTPYHAISSEATDWQQFLYHLWYHIQNLFNWSNIGQIDIISPGTWAAHSNFIGRFHHNPRTNCIIGTVTISTEMYSLYWNPSQNNWNNVVRRRFQGGVADGIVNLGAIPNYNSEGTYRDFLQYVVRTVWNLIKYDEHPVTTTYIGSSTWVGHFNGSFILQFSGDPGYYRWIIDVHTYSHTLRAEVDSSGNMLNPRYVQFTDLPAS